MSDKTKPPSKPASKPSKPSKPDNVVRLVPPAKPEPAPSLGTEHLKLLVDHLNVVLTMAVSMKQRELDLTSQREAHEHEFRLAALRAAQGQKA